MRFPYGTVILLAAIAFCSMPVAGINTFLGEGPVMTAAIAGTNQFSPGQNAMIAVTVQNQGVETDKFVLEGTIERDDLPTTAKMVVAGLSAGSAPVVVKADPQNIGDLASRQAKTITIPVKITSDATMGEYTLPLGIRYTYLASSRQDAADVLQSNYRSENVTIPLTIRIRPEVKIAVLDVTAENLSVGTGGYLDLLIRNDGSDDGKKATVRLIRSGSSPVIPTDTSVYVGDFPRGGTIPCRYKVAISGDAGEQTYPVDVAVTYENAEGDVITSSPETVGVPVLPKITFAVASGPVRMTPGSSDTVTVRYRNTGKLPAYDAMARITAADPFTSSDNNAYLGTLNPGDEATATYRISTDSGAAIKEYSLDTEIRYRDALDESQVSDTFRVPFQVVPGGSPAGGLVLPVVILVLVGIVAGYYLLRVRKRK